MSVMTGEKRDVSFDEAGYLVRSMTEGPEILESYRLRHDVFCDELGWVAPNAGRAEIDSYDGNAVPFGVFDPSGGLAAYLRLIMPGEQFMIEKEFLDMVDPGHKIRKEADTAEISRLCIATRSRRDVVPGDYGSHSVSVVLLKGIYRWCKLNRVRFLYAVTEQKIFRLACAKGFPFRLIGEPLLMPDGVVAVAMMLDWEEFEFTSALKRPIMAEWFSLYRTASAPVRPQPRGHGLQHQVFA